MQKTANYPTEPPLNHLLRAHVELIVGTHWFTRIEAFLKSDQVGRGYYSEFCFFRVAAEEKHPFVGE